MSKHGEIPAFGLVHFAEQKMAESAILENEFFSSLRHGTMSHSVFIATQRQFFFAVRYFPRTMAALTARIPDSAHRLPLVHNLAEEHGLRDDKSEVIGNLFHPALAHDRTILEFLTTVGVSNLEMLQESDGNTVRAFNLALMGVCAFEPMEMALACLGVIEFAFADISALIGKTVVERGWIKVGELVHYKLHAEIDKRHANDFFQAVEPTWNSGGATRSSVENGVVFGLYLFNRFYEELWREANRTT